MMDSICLLRCSISHVGMMSLSMVFVKFIEKNEIWGVQKL